jgi:arylsulfatase A-like enzyme
MKLTLLWLSSLILFASPSQAQPNVILITLDGVRWQEVFQDSAMPHLTGDLAKEGVLLGDEINSSVRVSNPVNMSLPGYQSIFLGTNHFCFSNFCKTVRKETFPETIQKAYAFSKNEMAAFASWEQIKRAYQRENSQLFLNAGLDPTDLPDPVHEVLDREQQVSIPKWNRPGIWSARFDRFTYAHALHFLKTKKPRFLYLSLLDADEWGHAGNDPEYRKTLQTYDTWIREVADFLDQSGDYGRNTLLIVTTDHGRGVGGDKWREHGIKYPESAKIWLYLRGMGIEAGSQPIPGTTMSHLSIKPMILRAFGLKYRKNRLKSFKTNSADSAKPHP